MRCGVPGCVQPDAGTGVCADHREQELHARGVAMFATAVLADSCPFCGELDTGGAACVECAAWGVG